MPTFQSERLRSERATIRSSLKMHPILLLEGPSATGLKRSMEVIIDENLPADSKFDGERKLALSGIHPDLILIDGRELKVDEARDIRSSATSSPARWPRRYLIISYLDRPHHAVVPTLLKIIEEPPPRWGIILTTSNSHHIPQTIPSRALKVKIGPSPIPEVESLMVQLNLDEPAWRALASEGDPDIAQELDPRQTRNWHKLWSAIIAGTSIPEDYPSTWGDILVEANEATQSACWGLLIQLLSKRIHLHSWWLEIALAALNAKSACYRGTSNKLLTLTTLDRTYGYAHTINKKLK
jgi:hypothetical protein